MRTVRKIHTAVSAPIGGLLTYRALPNASIDHIDPFLFLNHHGPQVYGPNNPGLPFGPHPHRGFETVTFVIKGDIMHWDSSGEKSVVKAGGIQWMTAGRGLIHSEVSSREFMQQGGEVEVLQLWLNLPARYKMVEPSYTALSREQIPRVAMDDEKVVLHLIAGGWDDRSGPVRTYTDIMLSTIDMKKGGTLNTHVDPRRNIFFYVVKGAVDVNGSTVAAHNLVEFANNEAPVIVKALDDSLILFGHGEPFNEPIVAHGPFVMNSEEEISAAYHDYRTGKMGSLEEWE